MKSFQNDSWVKTIINKSVASCNDASCAFSALLLTITAFFVNMINPMLDLYFMIYALVVRLPPSLPSKKENQSDTHFFRVMRQNRMCN